MLALFQFGARDELNACRVSWFPQNYLKAAWNVFDFVTVLGSITDILVTEIKVGSSVTPPWRLPLELQPSHCGNMPLGSSLVHVLFFYVFDFGLFCLFIGALMDSC